MGPIEESPTLSPNINLNNNQEKDILSTESSVKSINSEKVNDPYHFGYITFFFLGLTMLLPWNSIYF